MNWEELALEPRTVERRGEPRVPISCSVRVRIGEAVADAQMLDFSVHGIGLVTDFPIEQGASVAIVVGDDTHRGIVRNVHAVSGSYRVGVSCT